MIPRIVYRTTLSNKNTFKRLNMFIEMQVEHPLPVMHLQIDGSNKLVEINVKMGKVRRGWDKNCLR
jgi:hypothetical protein